MSSDWDEIKRLAADFQKAQLTSTLQKLSERNCIEIVSLLLQKGIVDIVFTNDGKEYITPEHLEREVLDELAVNGGRINLVEISKTLNVDLSKVEDVAKKIASDKKIHFMLGQLIEEDYIMRIAQEINEKLTQKGEMSVSDLTVHFDLPSDFLQQCVLEKYIGKIIRGRQNPSNPRSFFTHAYTQRCKAKMRGALSAIRKPTTLAVIFQQIGIDEKMFYSLLDEIAPLPGVVATKQSNSQYIPHIYAKMQKDWVTTSFKQNGVLDYNSIAKLGVTDAKQFIKKQLPNENMLFLERCAVDSKVIDLTLLSALNECSVTTSFVDLSTILPSYMSPEDIEELYQSINSSRSLPQNLIYFNTVVFSSQFLSKILKPCFEMADEKAKLAVESGSYQQHIAEKQSSLSKNELKDSFDETKVGKRDERRKKASSGKGGGGTQGRETKTKSTKRSQRGGNARNADVDLSDNDDMSKSSTKELELLKISEIEKIVSTALEEDGLEHLNEEIAARYYKELNQAAHATVKKLLEAVPQTNRRQTHASLQEKINMLVADIRLYEKGLKFFPSDVQTQLLKYVMKSLGNDICNDLTIFLANESNVNVKSVNNLNPDQRKKIAMECEPEYRAALLEVNKALNTTIDEFIAATESALKSCGMILRKVDKKKDRTLIVQHREKLCQQLSETDDKPLVLHLAALILFVTITGCILHASGRFVSHILAFIRPTMTDEQNDILMQYHDLVLKLLQLEAESEEYNNVTIQLNSLQMPLKDMVISYEKPGVSKTD